MNRRRDEVPARRLVTLSFAALLAALASTPANPLSAAPVPSPASSAAATPQAAASAAASQAAAPVPSPASAAAPAASQAAAPATAPQAAPAPLPAPPAAQPWQVVPSSGGLSRPLMPDSRLDPPSNVTPILFAYAQGVQRYVCAPKEKAPAAAAPAGPSGAAASSAAPAVDDYAWTLKEPQAKLFDRADHEIGAHSAGPTWQLKDGSKVVKKKVVATVPALESDGVPWLLVEVEPSGKGGLAGVQYVQRVDTVGGAAPPTGCTAANAKTTLDVEYRATYVFYAPPAAR